MKKLLLISIMIFYYGMSYSQEKWYISAELDFIFSNKKDYFYNDSTNKIYDTELEEDGFLLNSFGIQGSCNYFLFRKLSIGVLAGFQTQSNPDFSMLKLGGVLKYYFVNHDNIYVYLQDSNNFSLNKEKFKGGNNFRIGLGLPFMKREAFNLAANLFFEQNYFNLDGAEPLLGMSDEIPRSLTVKSIGVAIGAKF